VHLLEHDDVLFRWTCGQAAQPGHGRVHPVVARRRRFGRSAGLPAVRRCGEPGPFGIKILILTLKTLVWVFLVHVRYPPRGTLPSDVD
jgi:hypothetical protein